MNSNLKCPNCDYSLNDTLSQSTNKISLLSEENSFLKNQLNKLTKAETELKLQIKQRDKTIADLKKKIDDLVRATESHFLSQQHKGEAQELLLEELLQQTFPFDQIVPVPKGKNGADCLQIIKSPAGEEIGRILFESKNTKTYSEAWQEKLREDNLEAKAQIMVLVTAAKPKEQQTRFMIRDGIWIASFEDVAELVLVLRTGLNNIHNLNLTQENKSTYESKLYAYLTSHTFHNSFENVLTSFRSLQEAHHTEKLKMAQLWKQREKAMQNILAQSVELFTEIKESAGVVLPNLKSLGMSSLD